MALQVQTFTNFPVGKWEAFKAKILKDTGVEITSVSGTVVHGNFEFMYVYNATASVLTVQCLKKPFFINSHTVLQGLAEEIADLPVLIPPAVGPAKSDKNGPEAAATTGAVNTPTGATTPGTAPQGGPTPGDTQAQVAANITSARSK